MKFSRLFVFAGLLVGAASIQAAPTVAPDTALPAESSGLKISISPTVARDESELGIILHRGDPHLNIVLQNTSDKPIWIFNDGNSLGYNKLALQVTAIDGDTLDKPLEIKCAIRSWMANFITTDVIEAGQVIVREMRFNLPPEVFAPKPPVSTSDSSMDAKLSLHSPDHVPNSRLSFPTANFGMNSNVYFGFPFPSPNDSRTLTIRALFSNDIAKFDEGDKKLESVWTGNIASPLKDYRVFWGAD